MSRSKSKLISDLNPHQCHPQVQKDKTKAILFLQLGLQALNKCLSKSFELAVSETGGVVEVADTEERGSMSDTLFSNHKQICCGLQCIVSHS